MLWNGNVRGKKEGNGNLKATIRSEIAKSKSTGECGTFQLFG